MAKLSEDHLRLTIRTVELKNGVTALALFDPEGRMLAGQMESEYVAGIDNAMGSLTVTFAVHPSCGVVLAPTEGGQAVQVVRGPLPGDDEKAAAAAYDKAAQNLMQRLRAWGSLPALPQ